LSEAGPWRGVASCAKTARGLRSQSLFEKVLPLQTTETTKFLEQKATKETKKEEAG